MARRPPLAPRRRARGPRGGPARGEAGVGPGGGGGGRGGRRSWSRGCGVLGCGRGQGDVPADFDVVGVGETLSAGLSLALVRGPYRTPLLATVLGGDLGSLIRSLHRHVTLVGVRRSRDRGSG